MRFQTVLFVKGKGRISEIVRAEKVEEALTRSISTKDIVRAESGYAHPLTQNKPDPEDWRWDIRCSVTGIVTMAKKKPRRASGKEATDHEKVVS
jgi:hypothetical protein